MNPNGPVLSFVLTAGFLSSLNPCAIAVLLIFIALMFTLRKSRKVILTMGATYIASLFVTYLGIGLGILKVVNLFGIPHLLSLVGAWIVIAFGILGLKDYFLPGKYRLLSISIKGRQIVAEWAGKATIPTAAIAGLLVGLFEFPCAGAIYLAVVGLINNQETYLKGLSYLLLYNFMFVLPLIILLLITTNRLVTEKLINLDEKHSKTMRLITSFIMIATGVVILIWFV